ncbi:MAG TPA: SIMPL domain-containing protein [Acidobacteriaceae bacterium]|nr:SIMPL domain-containing protein [Acidobacteriaceae bacterium]
MKRWAILVSMLSVFSSAVFAQTSQGPSLVISKENRTLSVSAPGHAEADPDIADLNVGFVVYASTLQAAYKAAGDTSNAIVKAMLDAGASKSEIQSRSQRVSRLSDYEKKGMRFSITQDWAVRVAPKDAALILDAAVNAGANQSGDITWRMKSDIPLDTEAIRKASERARAIAAALAEGMGVTLGKPLFVTNNVSSGVTPRVYGYAGNAAMELKRTQPLAIETQRVERDATVEIVYALE